MYGHLQESGEQRQAFDEQCAAIGHLMRRSHDPADPIPDTPVRVRAAALLAAAAPADAVQGEESFEVLEGQTDAKMASSGASSPPGTPLGSEAGDENAVVASAATGAARGKVLAAARDKNAAMLATLVDAPDQVCDVRSSVASWSGKCSVVVLTRTDLDCNIVNS
jgi:hypothetical protein